MSGAALAALVLGLAGGGDDAGGTPARPAEAAELDRLEGHRVRLGPAGGYTIEDVAGEGPPLVGTVRREGADLVLATPGGLRLRLVGPLAVPRIAGPGYEVWAIGAISPYGMTLRARRIGILRAPVRGR